MLLLRHASAGEPLSSASLDRARRLDRLGRADARLLPEALAGYPVERVVSSPHARCVETVRAAALARNVEVELREELSPDAPLADTLALLAEAPDASLVCTHLDVIERLLGADVACEEGAAWLVEQVEGGVRAIAYLPSPTSQERATGSPNALV